MACPDCGEERKLCVLRETRGYYIGTRCACGPYSRRSGFYQRESDANAKLAGDEDAGRIPKG